MIMGDTCLPIEVVCTDPGLFSFFEESDRYEHRCHNHALHRAFSLVRKMGVRTLVREDLSADTETKFENEVIEAALGKKCKTASFRLSFFREPFDNECGITRAKSSSCLGYLIVVRIEPHEQGPIVFVKEALLEAPRLLHNYIHCTRRFKCRLAGRDFWITGSYFCQQNAITGACAHAALRTVLTDVSGSRAAPFTDRQINDALGLTPGQHNMALTDTQITHVLESFGMSPICHDFFDDPAVEYAEFIHPFLESGFPALLAFRTEDPNAAGHVVAVIGHTLNSDLWYPEARVGYPLTFPSGRYARVPASYWMDNLIVQDDNLGMYTCVSSRCLSKVTLPRCDPHSRAVCAFGLLRGRAPRGPLNAEYNATVLLTDGLRSLDPHVIAERWLRELALAVHDKRRSPVCRTVLVSRHRYVSHAGTARDWQGHGLSDDHLRLLEDNLPPKFWMVEISLPNLYSANKRKLGELLFSRMGPNRLDPLAGWIGGRLPGIFFTPAPGTDRVPHPVPSQLSGHVELYRGPKPSPMPPEWCVHPHLCAPSSSL